MGHNVSILQSYVATKRCRLLVVALQGKVLGSCIDRICILWKLSNRLTLKNFRLKFDCKNLGEVKRKDVILLSYINLRLTTSLTIYFAKTTSQFGLFYKFIYSEKATKVWCYLHHGVNASL